MNVQTIRIERPMSDANLFAVLLTVPASALGILFLNAIERRSVRDMLIVAVTTIVLGAGAFWLAKVKGWLREYVMALDRAATRHEHRQMLARSATVQYRWGKNIRLNTLGLAAITFAAWYMSGCASSYGYPALAATVYAIAWVAFAVRRFKGPRLWRASFVRRNAGPIAVTLGAVAFIGMHAFPVHAAVDHILGYGSGCPANVAKLAAMMW